ncbi:hypothetical protein [Actinomadura parmotrematis]|uniref:Conjugal transfer protein n=1 Tax=Actinomadura parmotrematis TaxID=2864039 RepID=A0ABS7FPK7_9ACTN|nr:hypothetical protein [Actinomadura parmotrematis]MBW8481493.1 hypothetical protein [Actinomadura parmotrematis]
MNPTDRQRKLLFGGLVVALTGVGVYLTVAGPTGDDDHAAARPSASASPSAGPTGPESPPPGISGPLKNGQFDIYRLLPFSQQEFTQAAGVAQRFMAAYCTFRYDEDPAAYLGRFDGLVTDEVRGQLQQAAADLGVQEDRKAKQTVAQGSASLDQVRTIEDNSIIFLVTGHRQLTEAGKNRQESRQFAVTVARDGGALKVYGFEFSDKGQAGDTE